MKPHPNSDAQAASAAIAAGGIGGFGGFGKKKQQQPAAAADCPTDQAQQQASASVLMEMASEMSGFSSRQ